MDIKMIVCDLDGTLLRSDKTLSQPTLDALAGCREKGIIIAIATARSEYNINIVTDFFVPDVLITSGGSVARYREQIVHQALLTADDANGIANKLTAVEGVGITIARTDEGYFTSKPFDSKGYEGAVVVDFTKNVLGQTQKIVVEMPSPEVAKSLLESLPNVAATAFTGEKWVAFHCKNAAKWQGVAAVAKHLGIETGEIVAFGDDFNDLEMVEKCGIGVAMENGISEIKGAADYVCDTNDNDGVAKWLEEYLLKEV
ncbi:MAG: Cof-type HAD-IIB family hydrolase [Defluviitaleaceae bacterium]|nr:Cof-type HAD-IIB family hydrolase [Defluviitaleaceae bacterium]